MKKIGFAISMALVLALLAAMPALAQTTNVDVNGKTYIFYGANGVYEADGMTFAVEDAQVTVTGPEAAEQVFPLEHAEDTAIIEEVITHYIASEDSNGAYVEATDMVCTVEEDGNVTYSFNNAGRVDIEADAAVVCRLAEGSAVSVETAGNEAWVPTEADFAAYAPFGLDYTAETGALQYQGQRVRTFRDIQVDEVQYACYFEYVDDEGDVDLEVIYDVNGNITGIRELTAEEAALQAEAWSVNSAEALSGDPLSEADLAALYAPYEAVGVAYDAETGALIYQGKAIRNFLDVRTSNGAALSSASFAGSMTTLFNEEGEIDVETIRDFAHPDENGEGKLIGLIVKNAE